MKRLLGSLACAWLSAALTLGCGASLPSGDDAPPPTPKDSTPSSTQPVTDAEARDLTIQAMPSLNPLQLSQGAAAQATIAGIADLRTAAAGGAILAELQLSLNGATHSVNSAGHHVFGPVPRGNADCRVTADIEQTPSLVKVDFKVEAKPTGAADSAYVTFLTGAASVTPDGVEGQVALDLDTLRGADSSQKAAGKLKLAYSIQGADVRVCVRADGLTPDPAQAPAMDADLAVSISSGDLWWRASVERDGKSTRSSGRIVKDVGLRVQSSMTSTGMKVDSTVCLQDAGASYTTSSVCVGSQPCATHTVGDVATCSPELGAPDQPVPGEAACSSAGPAGGQQPRETPPTGPGPG
jgi:hypothetical protein